MRLRRWQTEPLRGFVRLTACAAALALVWLGLLPRIARQPAISRYIDRNEKTGIDPSAKFYTELPAMPALFDRVESAQRRDAKTFW